MDATILMKIFRSIYNLLTGHTSVADATPKQIREAQRVHRKLTKFPRLRHAPNQRAHRTALFKARYGMA